MLRCRHYPWRNLTKLTKPPKIEHTLEIWKPLFCVLSWNLLFYLLGGVVGVVLKNTNWDYGEITASCGRSVLSRVQSSDWRFLPYTHICKYTHITSYPFYEINLRWCKPRSDLFSKFEWGFHHCRCNLWRREAKSDSPKPLPKKQEMKQDIFLQTDLQGQCIQRF